MLDKWTARAIQQEKQVEAKKETRTWKNINECHERFQKLSTTLRRRARTGCSIFFTHGNENGGLTYVCLSKRIHEWKLNGFLPGESDNFKNEMKRSSHS